MGFRPWAADAMGMRVLYGVVCTVYVPSIHPKKIANKFLMGYGQDGRVMV